MVSSFFFSCSLGHNAVVTGGGKKIEMVRGCKRRITFSIMVVPLFINYIWIFFPHVAFTLMVGALVWKYTAAL